MEQRLRKSWLMTCCMLSCGARHTSCLGGRPSAALSSRIPRIVCASISASLIGLAPLDTLRNRRIPSKLNAREAECNTN